MVRGGVNETAKMTLGLPYANHAVASGRHRSSFADGTQQEGTVAQNVGCFESDRLLCRSKSRAQRIATRRCGVVCVSLAVFYLVLVGRIPRAIWDVASRHANL